MLNQYLQGVGFLLVCVIAADAGSEAIFFSESISVARSIVQIKFLLVGLGLLLFPVADYCTKVTNGSLKQFVSIDNSPNNDDEGA